MSVKLRLKFRAISFILTCIAILSADLLVTLINKAIMRYNGATDRRVVVLIGMLAVLFVFYMLIRFITRFSEWFTDRFVHATRVFLGRIIGLYLSIATLLFLLFAGYYYAWFDRNIFIELGKSIRGILPGNFI
jgi:hypothetical protein